MKTALIQTTIDELAPLLKYRITLLATKNYFFKTRQILEMLNVISHLPLKHHCHSKKILTSEDIKFEFE